MKVQKSSVNHSFYFCVECWDEYKLEHIPVGDPVYGLSSSNPNSCWTGARFCEKHYIEFIKECADVAGFELVPKTEPS